MKAPLVLALRVPPVRKSKRPSPRPSSRCPECTSIGSAIRWRAASGEGGGSGVCGAMSAQTAWMIRSKIGSATLEPAWPWPSVRLPLALS